MLRADRPGPGPRDAAKGRMRMADAVWKGTLEFGLVNIPIGLYPAEDNTELELHMLDKRDMAPVGYNLVNKTTGASITRAQVVKGWIANGVA